MNTAQQSLRALVDKWLAPTPGTPTRVTRFSRMSSNHRRYVCVETARQTGVLAIYFFRHDDGWCVFPAGANGLTLDARAAALAG
jgi:hypothetical protein